VFHIAMDERKKDGVIETVRLDSHDEVCEVD
jgi:hypothetical protein